MPRSLLGISLSFLAVLFGVLTGVLVKRLGAEVNIVTALFYRFLFSLPILFLFAICVRGKRQKKNQLFLGLFCIPVASLWQVAGMNGQLQKHHGISSFAMVV